MFRPSPMSFKGPTGERCIIDKVQVTSEWRHPSLGVQRHPSLGREGERHSLNQSSWQLAGPVPPRAPHGSVSWRGISAAPEGPRRVQGCTPMSTWLWEFLKLHCVRVG